MALSSSFDFYEPWEIQPTKRRLCIGSDHIPYDYDIIPRQLLSYLSAFPELRRKKTGQHSIESQSIKEIKNNGENGDFQMCINVSQFFPNEISMKIKDDEIIIECSHEEIQDAYGGSIIRNYSRKIKIPEEYDAQNVTSSLTSDGVLIIKAPKTARDNVVERIVPIVQTGPAHLNIK